MILNYFKIALRNLWKDRTFTALNIFGLSLAFGTATLLGLYAVYELSYDDFHTNENIFQAYHAEQTLEGPRVSKSNPIPFAHALKDEVPGIKKITRYNEYGMLITHKEKQFTMSVAHVDPDFFAIFNLFGYQ